MTNIRLWIHITLDLIENNKLSVLKYFNEELNI